MLGELQEAICPADPTLRCIVLEAQGKVFSAGHNLKELVSYNSYSFYMFLLTLLCEYCTCKNGVKGGRLSNQLFTASVSFSRSTSISKIPQR